MPVTFKSIACCKACVWSARAWLDADRLDADRRDANWLVADRLVADWRDAAVAARLLDCSRGLWLFILIVNTGHAGMIPN